VISNCSNNYGPYQFPEKLIPLAIYRIMNGEEIPVYGKGENIRDWLYVEDHARAIDLLFHRGQPGETYNIGGYNEWKNIDLLRLLCRLADERLGNDPGSSERLISFVKDRAGHDLRYAIDAEKIRKELGWEPRVSFQEGLAKTLDWYLSHREWLDHVITGEYRQYYNRQYYDRPF
jgi:dTDP-glucose 4,6-dehydratase